MSTTKSVQESELEKKARSKVKLDAWKTCADALKDLSDEDKTNVIVSLKELFGIYIPNN